MCTTALNSKCYTCVLYKLANRSRIKAVFACFWLNFPTWLERVEGWSALQWNFHRLRRGKWPAPSPAPSPAGTLHCLSHTTHTSHTMHHILPVTLVLPVFFSLFCCECAAVHYSDTLCYSHFPHKPVYTVHFANRLLQCWPALLFLFCSTISSITH